MKLETFFEKFDQFADAPDAVAKMRELVLDLAIQGKLVERKASHGDGHSLLKKLRTLPPERNSKSRSPKDIVVEPETPLDIPTHWALTTVENTTRDTGFFCDGDWVESKDQDPDGDVRLIQLADVGDGQYRDRSSRFMTKAAATRLNCSYLEAGDILVARMPDPLGRCCRFPGDSKPAVTVVDVCILRPNVAFFDSDFLVVAINCPRFRRLVSAQATGTTRSRISRSNLGALPIPLPPLAEQKRIVAKVDELMALCDRLEAQLKERDVKQAALAKAALAKFTEDPTPENLHFLFHPSYAIPPADLRKSILTLAVQGKLVPQDPNDEPAEDLIERVSAALPDKKSENPFLGKIDGSITDESEYELPCGWAWLPLGHVGTWATGCGFPTQYQGEADKEFLFCKVSDMNLSGNEIAIHTTVHTIDADVMKKIRARANPAGTVIFPKIGGAIATHKRRLLIKPTIIDNNCSGIQPIGLTDERWLLLFMRNLDLTKYQSGTSVPAVSQGSLDPIRIGLPPLAEQRRIVAKVEQLMALVDALETQLKASRTTGEKLLEAMVAELTA